MITPTLDKDLDLARKEVALSTTPIVKQVMSLTVDTPENYRLMDTYLARIRAARKLVKERIGKVLDPINLARNEVLALRNELDGTLEHAELHARNCMERFKAEELLAKRAAEEARRRESDRLRQEAEEKEQALARAKTAPMKARLTQQVQELTTQADIVEAAPVAAPTLAVNSRTRTVRKVRVTDKAQAVLSVASGTIPLECVELSTSLLTAYFKRYPDEMDKAKGLEFFDEVQIVGR